MLTQCEGLKKELAAQTTFQKEGRSGWEKWHLSKIRDINAELAKAKADVKEVEKQREGDRQEKIRLTSELQTSRDSLDASRRNLQAIEKSLADTQDRMKIVDNGLMEARKAIAIGTRTTCDASHGDLEQQLAVVKIAYEATLERLKSKLTRAMGELDE